MNQLVDKLAEQAKQLNPDERVALIETLLAQLPDPDPEWEAAWAAEVERRMAAVERGEEQLIPAEKVMEKLRNRYRPQ